MTGPRCYILATGIVFALMFVAHAARMFAEPSALHEPIVIVTSILSLGLAIWAIILLRRPS